jgi:hypothetical protein
MATRKPQISISEEILTPDKVAEILGMSERTVLDKLRSKEITGYKKFNRWFVLKSDLIRLLTE